MNTDVIINNSKGADEIIKKIGEESNLYAADVLEIAKKEAEEIFSKAKDEAEKKKEEILKKTQKDIEKIKDEVSSKLNSEKKKIVLEEKNKFVTSVLGRVKNAAEGYRGMAQYRDFLKKSVLEGIAVIDAGEMVISFSELDREIFKGTLTEELKGLCLAKKGKDVSLLFDQGDFKDIGVIVKSKDGGLIYDNRFSARFKRTYDAVYIKLLKETF